MATKQLLVCDKCGHEAHDPSSTGLGMPGSVGAILSPMDRGFPALEAAWWRLVAMVYGVAFPIDLCPSCSKKVLDFLDIEPRQPGEVIEPPGGQLSIDDLKRLGIIDKDPQ